MVSRNWVGFNGGCCDGTTAGREQSEVGTSEPLTQGREGRDVREERSRGGGAQRWGRGGRTGAGWGIGHNS